MKTPSFAMLLALGVLSTAQAQESGPALKLSMRLAQAPVEKPAATPAPDPTHWASTAARWQPGSDACATQGPPPWDNLGLSDALAHHLCQSPLLRQALASVAEQSAALELADVARRPTWSASAEYDNSRNFNSSGNSGRTLGVSIGLSWVLFDFGQRSASLDAARQTLAAALASQGNTLLESVKELMRIYGEAVVAHASLEATTEAEATAKRTADAAQARYDAKVGNQIDRLQALTAQAQATLERVRAQSTWENARGALALALGGDIRQPMRLVNWESWARASFDPPDLDELRNEARAQHPRLRAVVAQIAALKAQLTSVQSANRGSVSLSASGGTSKNWGAAGSGNIPTASATLLASVPLFNGRESRAQQAQIEAQLTDREAELESLQRDTDSQLWQAHHALLTSRQSLRASDQLLEAADKTYQIAQGRYRAGVGSMLELLTAQSALADARRQHVAAQVEQLTAQTQLGVASGRFGH